MNIFLSIAAALILGLALTRLAKLVNMPNVTGYLVAGLLTGPYVLNLIPRESLPGLDLLITLALGFIAYSIGAEFKFSHLKVIGKEAVVIAVLQALGAVALVDIALVILGFPLPLALTLGAIAAATAPASTLMVVRQYRAKGPVTDMLLPVVALDDAVGLVVFSVSIVLAEGIANHTGLSIGGMILKPLWELFSTVLLGGLIGLAAVLSLRKVFHSKDNKLCVSIAAVALGVGLSEWLGLSALLMCMMIGGMVANFYEHSDAEFERCERFTPPLFLMFFVISGADLDLAAIPAVGLLGVGYLLARAFGKYLGTLAGASLMKSDHHIKHWLGLALLPQAGVAIGLAQMAAVALPDYGSQIRTVVLCATLIYEFAGPIITKIALTSAGEITLPRKTGAIKKAK